MTRVIFCHFAQDNVPECLKLEKDTISTGKVYASRHRNRNEKTENRKHYPDNQKQLVVLPYPPRHEPVDVTDIPAYKKRQEAPEKHAEKTVVQHVSANGYANPEYHECVIDSSKCHLPWCLRPKPGNLSDNRYGIDDSLMQLMPQNFDEFINILITESGVDICAFIYDLLNANPYFISLISLT